jgi:hypothetical protein
MGQSSDRRVDLSFISFIRIIKADDMVTSVAHMELLRNLYKIFGGKSE